MSEQIISALVEGGKATAGPPIGPALGPMGINAGAVVAEINEKTKSFVGITVPVKIIVDTKKKSYAIEIGTPPTSALIKKELGIERGSPRAKEEKAGDISVDSLIRISQMKQTVLHGRGAKERLKEVIGSCIPMGILVGGGDPRDAQKDVDAGKYDAKIGGKEELREMTAEERLSIKERFRISEKKEEPKAAKAEAAPAAAPAKDGKKGDKGKKGKK